MVKTAMDKQKPAKYIDYPTYDILFSYIKINNNCLPEIGKLTITI